MSGVVFIVNGQPVDPHGNPVKKADAPKPAEPEKAEADDKAKAKK